MRKNMEALSRVIFLTGDSGDKKALIEQMADIPAKEPFGDAAIAFLNDLSKELMSSKEARLYSDVITFAFWIRKGAVWKLKERFWTDRLTLGVGVVFHIAPSNVPVNFAYSLVSGLLTGNANIVRVPSKDFPQVRIITDAIRKALEEHEEMKPYVAVVRYGKDKEVNDLFSSLCDMRVIWGGDQTIAELRKSALPSRSGEIAFADRYSFAVIDSDSYMDIEEKGRVAESFYNDTFFSDQNACTSPRMIIWTGGRIHEAKERFWDEEQKIVEQKYEYRDIQGVDKLAGSYILAANKTGIKIKRHKDNRIVRVMVSEITDDLMDYQGNSGYFLEYDCGNLMELWDLCNNKKCQTVAYIGKKECMLPLLKAGVRGIDRVVPVGKTMDFDLIWDGYDLTERLTRKVALL